MHREARRRHAVLPAALVAAALGATLAGCGSAPTDVASGTSSDTARASSTPTPSVTASATPDLPACAAVWKAGARLPAGYRGCLAGGKVAATKGLHCESGQLLFIYGKHFFGVPDAKIYRVAVMRSDPEFKKVWRACGG